MLSHAVLLFLCQFRMLPLSSHVVSILPISYLYLALPSVPLPLSTLQLLLIVFSCFHCISFLTCFFVLSSVLFCFVLSCLVLSCLVCLFVCLFAIFFYSLHFFTFPLFLHFLPLLFLYSEVGLFLSCDPSYTWSVLSLIIRSARDTATHIVNAGNKRL